MSENKVTVKLLVGCPRCGKNHVEVTYNKLTQPCNKYTHWAMCPENSQPILLEITDDTDEIHEDYIEEIVVVSTIHIPPKEAENLYANHLVTLYGERGEYGYIMLLGSLDAYKDQGRVSEEMIAVLQKLEEMYPNIPRVQFDRDGLIHPELPAYDF